MVETKPIVLKATKGTEFHAKLQVWRVWKLPPGWTCVYPENERWHYGNENKRQRAHLAATSQLASPLGHQKICSSSASPKR